MGDADVIAATRIVGRDDEKRLLRERIDGAAAGQPCAVFVHGEAGIGKTSLVRSVVADAARAGVTVLWGRCLRFGAVESTYLPFVLAIEGWLQEAPTADREAVLRDVSGAALLLPSLGGAGPAAPVRLMPVVDEILSRIVALGPTVLVVDDVQWAAPASWDALGYLCAGFRHQPLAVVTTHRDEEQSPGDPFLGWLADMRRMPSVTTLSLGRLRPEETEDQLVGLLGGPVQQRLLSQVSDRSGGNPYLTEMLVEGLSAGAACLPDGLPDALGEALLAAWHRMSSPARKVAQVLAVGGRPASLADLAEVASARGLGPAAVEDAADEAVARGILVPARAGVWFRHPLLAEVLLSTLLPGQAAPWHAAWATTLERTPATGIEELRRLAALALHHEGAADPARAVDFSLRAARLAHELGAPRAEARHLQRAVRLAGPAGTLDGPAYLDLLEGAAHACALVGEQERAADLWHQALGLVDERVDPLRASRLFIALSSQEWGLGRVEEQPVGTARRCVELTSGHPDSGEHAEALANLAFCASWAHDEPTAAEAAQCGVEAARRSGSPRALAAAHAARAFVMKDADSCREDIDEALRQAEQTDDLELLVDAYISQFNYQWDRGRVADGAALSRRALTDLLARGGVIGVPLFAGILADSLLSLGRIREAAGVVRDGLAVGGLGHGAAYLRLVAAQCAVRRGRLPDADQHLARAYELIPTLEERPGLGAPPLVAEVLLARGEPHAALAMITRTLEVQSVDGRMVDLMLMWGARAAADLADHARDRRDADGVRRARELLDRLVGLRDGLAGVPFTPMVPDDPALPAFRAVFEAESARCTGNEGLAGRWAEVAELCDRADLGWEAQLARTRQASCLCDQRAGRAEIAGPLGEVHRFAVQEEAMGLQQRVEGIARPVRVPLVHPEPVTQLLGGPFGSLTGREREILGHLVNGLTYAQIARTLFISEKTVSSHVSNVLRKTGTSSRHEVAALSLRVATTEADHLGAKGSAVHTGAHDLPRPP